MSDASDLEMNRKLAQDVFASLDASAETVRLFAQTLALCDGAVSEFAQAFDYWADVLESRRDPEPLGDNLAVLAMARALRLAARDDRLTVRLTKASEPPWPAVLRAMHAISDS